MSRPYVDPVSGPSAEVIMRIVAESLWLNYIPISKSPLPELEFADREQLANDFNTKLQTTFRADDFVIVENMGDIIHLVRTRFNEPKQVHPDQPNGQMVNAEALLVGLDLRDPDTYQFVGIVSDIHPGIDQNSLHPNWDLAHDLGFNLDDEILLQQYVEEEFSIEIPPDQLTELKTIGDWVARIKKAASITIVTEAKFDG